MWGHWLRPQKLRPYMGQLGKDERIQERRQPQTPTNLSLSVFEPVWPAGMGTQVR